MTEAGLPGFQANTDYALFAPAGTPKEIVTRLNRETITVLGQPDVRARLEAIGIDVSGSTPEELRAQILAEFDKWTKVFRDANIKPE